MHGAGEVTRTLLLTDLVNSTLLIADLGDARAGELMAEHARMARQLLETHHGREIDKTDGFLLLFDEVADAVRYALAYHRALRELAATRRVDLAARAGIHTGTVTLHHTAPDEVARGAKPVEVEGIAKPVAARVMSLAGVGQTLLTAEAHRHLGLTIDGGQGLPDDVVTIDHGLYLLKGVEDPQRIVEVGVADTAPLSPPEDVAKACRVVPLADGGFRPAREIPNNLPRDVSSFIGRQGELRELAKSIHAGAALVTVVGPGGTGKTRLACRYALTRLGDFPGGAWFCDLSEATTLDDVLTRMASALGVMLDKDPVRQLGHAIAGRDDTLIVIDNFEQVVEHAGATVAHWMNAATHARFVVTSRELLQLEGERAFPVEPLPAPADDSLESLRSSDAASLFVDRARNVSPKFELTDANAAAIAELVRLLDGLPLAIELAAARARVLSPAKIVERLSKRFMVLRSGKRDRSARQNTLLGAIDWSWDLCTGAERLALAQCSVFRGGFDLEAAEAVLDASALPDAPWPMDLVQALVDKSLLRSSKPPPSSPLDTTEQRFSMFFGVQSTLPTSSATARPS